MFELAGGIFEKLQRIDKIYRKYFQEKLAAYDFSPNEIVVILFLYNNAPALDTATDIARCKGISKGLIARSVDSLCKRGFLEAVRDERDRRVIHLRLRDEHSQIRREIDTAQRELEQEIEKGISREDLTAARETMSRLLSNTELLLDRR